MNQEQVFKHIEELNSSYQKWKHTDLDLRIKVVNEIKNNLLNNTEQYAKIITTDMNKPISQSISEVKKCALLCDYYTENIKNFLKPQSISTQWSQSFITFEPQGVLLGIMPWNFPFWQVFRFVIPNILLGNLVVVKHASNVPLSANVLENIFKTDNVDYLIYKNLPISSNLVPEIIGHQKIRGVSLTGSESAGKAVAECAGKNLKKTVLELGGSAAFIVCKDADINTAVNTAINARMQNAGQSCIAAKRFLIQEEVLDKFLSVFKQKIENLKQGDKFNPDTDISEMTREDLAIELENIVNQSVKEGGKIIHGGKRKGSFYEPTILFTENKNILALKEETFGPVAVVTSFKTFEEAIQISNNSNFGLGVSIFSNDIEFIKSNINQFDEGAVYINEMLISDPKLPFGGVKNSGYGREMGQFGLYEFANIKTVVVK